MLKSINRVGPSRYLKRKRMQGVLEATNLFSQRNKLQVTFNVNFVPSHAISTLTFGASATQYTKITKYSAKHYINKLCFETRAVLAKEGGGFGQQHQNQLYVKFTKEQNDDAIYSIHLSSINLKINKKFFSDDTEWRLICENNQLEYAFDATVQVEEVTHSFKNSNRGFLAHFATLHDDTELTDFELRGTDGSVRLHSAVLAAFSPALRRMLEGIWKETENRVLEIPETSRDTLQHLKDYLYMDVLPEKGVEQLLLLASCYLMEDLKNKCMNKMISNINAENAVEISKFALAHNILDLYFAFLERIRSDTIKVKDIRECNK